MQFFMIFVPTVKSTSLTPHLQRKHIGQKLGREDASHPATRDHEWSRKCITCPKAVDLRFLKVNSQGSTAITTKISQKKKMPKKIEIWRMTFFKFSDSHGFFPPKQRLEAKPSSTKICQQPDLTGAPGIFLPSSFGMANVAHTNPAAAKTHSWCRMIRAGLMKTIGFPQ